MDERDYKALNEDLKRLYPLHDVTPRQKFVSEMEYLLIKLKEIDKETPWQNIEPEWWLAMDDIIRMAISAVHKFKK